MKFLPFILLWFACSHLEAADRPNILWITSEDNAAHWLGCYGNSDARTPRLDALAKKSLRFGNAYSNAPVCAVARSTILNGAHAITQGTQHMRSRHPIPARFKPHVSYLRDRGYYCTNNSKTDYNFKGDDNAIWDDSSKDAHYRNRPADKPFFAIFNLTVSHESSLFPATIAANRKRGLIPQTPRITPAAVELPDYLPDLPEIRSDIAIYHDTVTALDRQVGALLEELEKSGLADDTLVFYYSDHGGGTPRGKRYLQDTGVRVPMLVHIPEKWSGLSPFKSGTVVDEVISFVDLAPTLLSLAGLDKPAAMQGRAFLGGKRTPPPAGDFAYLYADRFDDTQGMRRGLTDGRWKYIRCFTPYLPGAPYSSYPLGQAGWSAWKKAWQAGSLGGGFKEIWESPQPVEMLFHIEADPWETANLAIDPNHADRLKSMRRELMATMARFSDIGLVPESMFDELAPGTPVADYLATRRDVLPNLIDFVFQATSRDKAVLPSLAENLLAPDPLFRYWAAQGYLILSSDAGASADSLTRLLADPHAAIRAAAGHALNAMGRKEPDGRSPFTE